MIRTVSFALLAVFLVSCGKAPPKKADIPSLNPEEAGQLLHYNNKAQDWLKYVRRQNPACDYHLELPDQTNHPATIDLSHIMLCANRPSPMEFDATISFEYDANQGKWVISRFAS